ncbi:hypothetical protein Q1695_012321 [Nippostrongylus brasiliensis]|nr:hypothetical protein Q1695_012321 [Nippostrongylus brasiliensis]
MDMDEHREDTTPSEVAAADIQSEPAEPKQPQQEVEDQIELEQNDEDLIKIGDADDSNDEDEAEDPPPREDNVQAPANAVQEPRHRIRPAPADITAQLKNLLRNARQLMKPTTTAVKLDVNLSDWLGSSLNETMTPQDRCEIAGKVRRALVRDYSKVDPENDKNFEEKLITNDFGARVQIRPLSGDEN